MFTPTTPSLRDTPPGPPRCSRRIAQRCTSSLPLRGREQRVGVVASGVRRLECAQARLLPPPPLLCSDPSSGRRGIARLTLGQRGVRLCHCILCHTLLNRRFVSSLPVEGRSYCLFESKNFVWR